MCDVLDKDEATRAYEIQRAQAQPQWVSENIETEIVGAESPSTFELDKDPDDTEPSQMLDEPVTTPASTTTSAAPVTTPASTTTSAAPVTTPASTTTSAAPVTTQALYVTKSTIQFTDAQNTPIAQVPVDATLLRKTAERCAPLPGCVNYEVPRPNKNTVWIFTIQEGFKHLMTDENLGKEPKQ